MIEFKDNKIIIDYTDLKAISHYKYCIDNEEKFNLLKFINTCDFYRRDTSYLSEADLLETYNSINDFTPNHCDEQFLFDFNGLIKQMPLYRTIYTSKKINQRELFNKWLEENQNKKMLVIYDTKKYLFKGLNTIRELKLTFKTNNSTYTEHFFTWNNRMKEDGFRWATETLSRYNLLPYTKTRYNEYGKKKVTLVDKYGFDETSTVNNLRKDFQVDGFDVNSFFKSLQDAYDRNIIKEKKTIDFKEYAVYVAI